VCSFDCSCVMGEWDRCDWVVSYLADSLMCTPLWMYRDDEARSQTLVGLWWVWDEWEDSIPEMSRKYGQNHVQKSGFGGRQVGAFSVFRSGDTGIPFIFWQKTLFFHKIARLRGWCNITPSVCGNPGFLNNNCGLYSTNSHYVGLGWVPGGWRATSYTFYYLHHLPSLLTHTHLSRCRVLILIHPTSPTILYYLFTEQEVDMDLSWCNNYYKYEIL